MNKIKQLLEQEYLTEDYKHKEYLTKLVTEDQTFLNYFLNELEFYITEKDEKKLKIKVVNKGLLEIPQGEKFYNLPLSHYIEIAKKKGYQSVSRALTLLMVFNRKKSKSTSDKALELLNQLRLQVQHDRKNDVHQYKNHDLVGDIKKLKRVDPKTVGAVLDSLNNDNPYFEFKNGIKVMKDKNNSYLLVDDNEAPEFNKEFTRKEIEKMIKINLDNFNNETEEYYNYKKDVTGQKDKPKAKIRNYKSFVTQSDKVKSHNVFRDLTDKEYVDLSSGGKLIKVDKNKYMLQDVEDNSLDTNSSVRDILDKKDVEYLIKNNPNEFDAYKKV